MSHQKCKMILTSMRRLRARQLYGLLFLLITLVTTWQSAIAQNGTAGQHAYPETPVISAIKPPPAKPELTVTTYQLDAWIDAHHFKAVRMVTEARIRANPKDADALYFLSRVKFAYQQRDAAIELAEKAIALNPNNAE